MEEEQNIAAGELSERLGLLCRVPEPLLNWYDRCARVLPWRDDPTPYHVWVSEIMLQQTRVEAVKPYYARFLEELPTVRALAEAPEEQLLKLWQGLGYYNRVRSLQKGARAVMEQYGGELPASVERLRELPGIGPYTAGAIASIAFNIPAPAVDGNVLRVVSRLLADDADIASPRVKKQVEEEISRIIPARAGDFTQALMELGAIVCVPNGEAKCGECPLAFLCRANREGRVTELPVKAAKKPRVCEERTLFLLISGNRAALRRRPEKGLLSGLWELPSAEGALSEEAARRQLSAWGVKPGTLQKLKKAKHIFTHVEWHLSAWAAEVEECGGEFLWASGDELKDRYTLPFAFKAYFPELEKRLCGEAPQP